MPNFIRTPDNQFNDLKEFKFNSSYLYDPPFLEKSRMHYIDTGENIKGIVLFLHGNPSWSFGYRKMISKSVEKGYRAIAPDLLGYGKSDKPIDYRWHTYDKHIAVIKFFIESLDLKNVTLVCHDWGGFFGLNIVPLLSDRFKNILLLNTTLCSSSGMNNEYHKWLEYVKGNPDIDLVKCFTGTNLKCSNEMSRAYSAPFPNYYYKSALRNLPFIAKDINFQKLGDQSLDYWKNHWHGKSYFGIGNQDIILYNPMMEFCKTIANHGPIKEYNFGHFLFEIGDTILNDAINYFEK